MGYRVWLGCDQSYDDTGKDANGAWVDPADRSVGPAYNGRLYMGTPDDWTLAETFVSITSLTGAWAKMVPDETPSWIASDSKGLVALLSEVWPDAELRPVPDDAEGGTA
jgi:hypothetical protein